MDNAKLEVIAEINSCGVSLPEHEANARLIAAAPQMLEALRLVLAEYAKRTSHTVLSARTHVAVNAAIKSARGITHPQSFASDFTLPENPSTPA